MKSILIMKESIWGVLDDKHLMNLIYKSHLPHFTTRFIQMLDKQNLEKKKNSWNRNEAVFMVSTEKSCVRLQVTLTLTVHSSIKGSFIHKKNSKKITFVQIGVILCYFNVLVHLVQWCSGTSWPEKRPVKS